MSIADQPKYKAGDRVTFRNDYGARFPGKTILRLATGENWDDGKIRYYITPTDTPWFPSREDQLIKE